MRKSPGSPAAGATVTAVAAMVLLAGCQGPSTAEVESALSLPSSAGHNVVLLERTDSSYVGFLEQKGDLRLRLDYLGWTLPELLADLEESTATAGLAWSCTVTQEAAECQIPGEATVQLTQTGPQTTRLQASIAG